MHKYTKSTFNLHKHTAKTTGDGVPELVAGSGSTELGYVTEFSTASIGHFKRSNQRYTAHLVGLNFKGHSGHVAPLSRCVIRRTVVRTKIVG